MVPLLWYCYGCTTHVWCRGLEGCAPYISS
jgi:hypothetical protein